MAREEVATSDAHASHRRCVRTRYDVWGSRHEKFTAATQAVGKSQLIDSSYRRQPGLNVAKRPLQGGISLIDCFVLVVRQFLIADFVCHTNSIEKLGSEKIRNLAEVIVVGAQLVVPELVLSIGSSTTVP